MPRATLSTLVLQLVLVAGLLAQEAPTHPLDGLGADEIRTVGEVVRASSHTDSSAVFASVQLLEPPKAEVLAWEPGEPFGRRALAVLRQGRQTYEAVVDVAAARLVSWTAVEGHSHVTGDEMREAGRLMLDHPEVRAALERRGLTDLATIECWGGPLGYFDRPDQRGGRRILEAGCNYVGDGFNSWSREIAGLTAAVDIDAGEVLRVEDTGALPLATTDDDFDIASVGPLRDPFPALEIDQPFGPGFTMDGHVVSWGDWRFHVRIDPRVGAIVSRVGIFTGDGVRPVLYQGALSEIFVPYQDSTENWYNRVFLDGGEYADGGLPEPLEPGVDCPDHAVYLRAIWANHDGLPFRRRRVACIFESTVGLIAWRHGYEDTEHVDGRPDRTLTLRWNVTAGNYDYLIDWIFRRNGGITVAVGATGILEVRTVAGTSIEGPDAVPADDLTFGRLLAPRVLGVDHDHFFSFRLDFDVDGVDNALAVGRLERMELPDDHPRRSVWTVRETVAETEHDARLDIDLRRPALWRVVSSEARGPMGYPTSYQIAPRGNAYTLLHPEDWPQIRAGFSAHHLWVTPYAADERYAAGDYPTLSAGAYGLPTWTEADRPIRDTDIVAWYTLGFHHVPRAEDWPVMPTAWHAFDLRPFDFFARNPTLDLPMRP